MYKIWQQEELNFLKSNYELKGAPYCAEILERSLSSIKHQASRLNLRSKGRTSLMSHSEYEDRLFELEVDAFPLEKYVNSRTAIEHTCFKGHKWSAIPANLTRKNPTGCPKCAGGGFNQSKLGRLYYVRIEYENLLYYKVGITNRSVYERFRDDRDKLITILMDKEYELGLEAAAEERKILNEHLPVCVPNFLKGGGNTELFETDVLGLDIQ